jgi:hypothetical protein
MNLLDNYMSVCIFISEGDCVCVCLYATFLLLLFAAVLSFR